MSFRPIPCLAALTMLCLSSFAAAQFPRSNPEIVAPTPPKPAKQTQVTTPAKKPNQVVAPAKTQGQIATPVTTKRGHKPSAKKIVEVPPTPPPPPTPTTLAQMPPVPPKVTYAGGQLTIDAPNSRLSDVLSAVRRATGTSFEGPMSDERVAVKLGPGGSRDVIDALLHGSRLDYVILAADNDPSQAQRVLLMQSSGGGQPGTVAVQGAPRPNPQPMNQGDPDMGDEPVTTDEVPDQTVTEPPPNNAGEIENPANQNTQENNQNQQQPKTPEQLLQELQQLQQQQQQQLQQMQQNNPNNQNQNNQGPPPE